MVTKWLLRYFGDDFLYVRQAVNTFIYRVIVIHVFHLGHMTKMPAIPIYGKNL